MNITKEAVRQQCVFCDIVAGKAPAHVISEDGLSNLFY